MFERYKPMFVGGLAGLLLAVLLLSFGFFKTIFALVLIGLGMYGGRYLQQTGLWYKWFK